MKLKCNSWKIELACLFISFVLAIIELDFQICIGFMFLSLSYIFQQTGLSEELSIVRPTKFDTKYHHCE